MSKVPLLLEQKEFDVILKDGNRIEVIAIAYADGRLEQLPNNYYKHFLRMKKAFSILVEEPVRRRAMKRIEDALNLSYAEVQKLVSDVQLLFPQIEAANREFDRLIMIERIERLIDKIENGVDALNGSDQEGEDNRIGGDVHSSSLPKLYQLLAEIQGLKVKDAPLLPYNELKLPMPVFSTDINDMPGAAAEETDFEELDDPD